MNTTPPNASTNNSIRPPSIGTTDNIAPIVDTNNDFPPSTTGPPNDILSDTHVNNNVGLPSSTNLAKDINPPNVNTNNDRDPPSANPATMNINLPNVQANNNGVPPSISQSSQIPPSVNTNNNGGGFCSINLANDNLSNVKTNDGSPPMTSPSKDVFLSVNITTTDGDGDDDGNDKIQQPSLPNPVAPNSSENNTSNYPHMAHEFIHHHNAVRAATGLQPLSWDKELARHARRWSDKRRGDCQLKHSGNKEYGENMFWGTGWNWKAADAVTYWANEHLYYDLESNECAADKVCGHFTQIVWNTTMKVGCGIAQCYNGQMIITCNYFPPGNFVGERPFSLDLGVKK